MILRRARNIGLAAVALVGVTAFGSASAAIPDASGKLNACYNVAMHNFRLVDPASTSPFPDEKACTSNETAIAWGQTGPQGAQGAKGDTGDRGPQGPKGDPGPRGNSFARMTPATGTFQIDDVEYTQIFKAYFDSPEGPYTVTTKFFIGGNTAGNVKGNCLLLVDGNAIDSLDFWLTDEIMTLSGTMIGAFKGGNLELKCQRRPNTDEYVIADAKALVTAVGSLR